MTLSHGVKVTLSIIFQILTWVAVITAGLAQEWQVMAITLLAVFLYFLPSIYQRHLKVTFPNEYEILILIFIFGSLYLGEVHDFYFVFPWWDVFLHTLSGILMFIFALSLAYVMDREQRIIFRSPFFVVFFATCFALACGSLWELFEYWMDTTWGTNMLKSGLDDTMLDMLNNTQGALFVAVIAYFEIKYQWKAKFIMRFNKHAKMHDLEKFQSL